MASPPTFPSWQDLHAVIGESALDREAKLRRHLQTVNEEARTWLVQHPLVQVPQESRR